MVEMGGNIGFGRETSAEGGLAVRAYVLALAVTLGGCSASELVQNWTPPPVADLSQPNYRRIIADSIKSIFPNQDTLGEMEISGIRPVDHLKGAAWIVCLKLDARGNPQHYAIFIQGDKVIDQRAGIVIDQCYKETYTPFELPTAATKPVTTCSGPGGVGPSPKACAGR
jgi:hypothetical protein